MATDIITTTEATSPQEYDALIEDMKNQNESLLYLTNLLQTRLAATAGQALPASKVIEPYSNGHSLRIDPLEIEGTLILCRLMKSRLLFALEPARFSALETESQNLAGQVMNLEKQLSEKKEGRLMGGLFMSQTAWIASATIKTHDIWKTESENEGFIAEWKFEAWCRAMGRRINVLGYDS